MKLILAATLLLGSSGSVFCAEYDKSIDVLFPDQLGSLVFKAKKAFPQQALGVNYGYERPRAFLRGAVFVYTGGLSAIPAGTDSTAIRSHFDQVIDEVKSLERLGKAKSVTMSPIPGQVTKYAGCGPQFIWRSYVIDLDGNTPIKAYTYLTVISNNFVKLRISTNDNTAESERDVNLFVADVRKLLGRCK